MSEGDRATIATWELGIFADGPKWTASSPRFRTWRSAEQVPSFLLKQLMSVALAQAVSVQESGT